MERLQTQVIRFTVGFCLLAIFVANPVESTSAVWSAFSSVGDFGGELLSGAETDPAPSDGGGR